VPSQGYETTPLPRSLRAIRLSLSISRPPMGGSNGILSATKSHFKSDKKSPPSPKSNRERFTMSSTQIVYVVGLQLVEMLTCNRIGRVQAIRVTAARPRAVFRNNVGRASSVVRHAGVNEEDPNKSALVSCRRCRGGG